MLKRLIPLLPVLAFILCACGVTKAKPEAEALAAKYFTAIQNGAFQEALPLYSAEFFKRTSKQAWLKSLEKNRQQLGALEHYQLLNWSLTVKAGSGTSVTLVYQVKYSRQEVQETFVVHKPGSGGPALIASHNLNSQGRFLPGIPGPPPSPGVQAQKTRPERACTLSGLMAPGLKPGLVG